MQEHEITTPQDLDSALASNALSKRQKLWKAASGKSPRWTDVLMAVLGAVQLIAGGIGAIISDERYYAFLIGSGVLMFCYSLWKLQQTQIDALREIVESIDKGSG
jgi:hypothetical protein